MTFMHLKNRQLEPPDAKNTFSFFYMINIHTMMYLIHGDPNDGLTWRYDILVPKKEEEKQNSRMQ